MHGTIQEMHFRETASRKKRIIDNSFISIMVGFTPELTQIETPRNDTECVDLSLFGPQSADSEKKSADCGPKERKSTHSV